MKNRTYVLLALFCLNFMMCKQDIDTFDCASVTPTYTNGIKLILDQSCATSGCHDSKTKEKGYDFSTYQSTKNHIGDKSFLGSIQHKKGYEKMPDGADKLDDATIKLLSCWSQNGAPE